MRNSAHHLNDIYCCIALYNITNTTGCLFVYDDDTMTDRYCCCRPTTKSSIRIDLTTVRMEWKSDTFMLVWHTQYWAIDCVYNYTASFLPFQCLCVRVCAWDRMSQCVCVCWNLLRIGELGRKTWRFTANWISYWVLSKLHGCEWHFNSFNIVSISWTYLSKIDFYSSIQWIKSTFTRCLGK